ncbi:MAG TPA: hypothetical protein VIF88_02075 [Methylocystis sp.]|jgi:hypothetical protein
MTYIRNTQTEKVHRALSSYIRPRLKNNGAVDFTKLFCSLDDRNIVDHIDDILGGAIRLTAGELATDASPSELRDKMTEAAKPDGTKKADNAGEVDEGVVAKVLMLLESRLTPSELMAVRDILRRPNKKKSAFDPSATTAEDAALAYDAYAKRFPNGAKVRIEPVCAPEPQRAEAIDPAGYFERFPNARRIGL